VITEYLETIDYIMIIAIPFLTAIVAKVNTADWHKGLITATWTAIAAILGPPLTAQGWVDFDADLLSRFLTIWLGAIASWLGLTREWVAQVHTATKGFIGKTGSIQTSSLYTP